MKRTARKDSNYVVYTAHHGDNVYIGITRKGKATVLRAVKERWRKHISRARHEDRAWALYQYINAGNYEGWDHTIVAIIRGRAEAYSFEQGLVEELRPNLNTQYM